MDWRISRTINVKYGAAEIPKYLPRIITLNSENAFWPECIDDETKAAIKERVHFMYVTEPLFATRKELKIFAGQKRRPTGTTGPNAKNAKVVPGTSSDAQVISDNESDHD